MIARPTIRLVLFLAFIWPVQLPAIPTSAATIRTVRPITELEQGIHRLINQERKRHGLRPLSKSEDLQLLARAQASDMAEHGRLRHWDSNGRDLQARVSGVSSIRWKAIGENIALVSAGGDIDRRMVRGWLNSPAHRRSILSSRYDATGIGLVQDRDGSVYGAQIFMQSSCPGS